MPKIRTNKTAAKRFKVSGTGKITRRKAYNSHQFLHKNSARKRRLELEPEVFQGEQRRIRRLLVMGLTKATKLESRAVKAPVDKAERAKADRAKLVSMLTR